MKIFALKVISSLFVALLMSNASAQSNSAADAVLAVCRAVGVTAAQAKDATGCVKFLKDNKIIDGSTADSLAIVLVTGKISSGQFAVFLGDVLNGTAAAPSTAAALRTLGIPANTPVTAGVVQSVLSNPAVTSAIQNSDTYKLLTSPTRP